MSRYDEIKYHSQQKQNCIKFAKTNKRIGVLSSCIGVASTILACTCTFNDGTDWGINDSTFYTIGAGGILMGIMFLRMSADALKSAKNHQKQIHKIQKQR